MRTHWQRDTRAMKSFLLFLFLPVLNFPENCPSYRLYIINKEIFHRLMQTPCLHLSRSISLRKTLVADHYLRIDYPQR